MGLLSVGKSSDGGFLTGLLFIGKSYLLISKSFGFGIDQAIGFGIRDSKGTLTEAKSIGFRASGLLCGALCARALPLP